MLRIKRGYAAILISCLIWGNSISVQGEIVQEDIGNAVQKEETEKLDTTELQEFKPDKKIQMYCLEEPMLFSEENMVDEKGTYSYQSGAVIAEFADGTLTLSGNGEMQDYENSSDSPWYDIRNNIERIVITEGVRNIGQYAFVQCTNAKEVIFPSTVTSIGDGAFYGCRSLSNIVIPESVRTLGSGVFAQCYSLAEITIAEGINSIGDYCFQNTSIQLIEIPSTVTDVSSLSFAFMSKLTDIQVDQKNSNYSSLQGVLFDKEQKVLLHYPVGKTETQYIIPNAVTNIGDSAFMRASNLQEIMISSSVTVIGDWAFTESGLRWAEIPDSVMTMGRGCFNQCYHLIRAAIGNGVTELETYMFEECESLTDITLGSNLTMIWHRAFTYCTSLRNIIIPEGVTEIAGSAFYGCEALETVTLPSTLKKIWYQVFAKCTSLKTIILPEGLTFIGPTAFYGCTLLQTLEIPSTVNEIGKDAFAGCDNLKVNIPLYLKEYPDGSYLDVITYRISGKRVYSYAYEVLNIVNEERSKYGCPPLSMNQELLENGMVRAAEIAVYFEHERPSGKDCFSINDDIYAENIAAGYITPANVMNGWMNSAGHRGNILTSGYTEIGIGCFQYKGIYYWVQVFGMNTPESFEQPEDMDIVAEIDTSPEKFEIYIEKQSLRAGTSEYPVCYAKSKDNGDLIQVNSDSFRWVSSDSEILSFDSDGKMNAVKGGQVTIRAYSRGDRYYGETQINITDKSKGDINADGDVGIADLIQMLHHISGRQILQGNQFRAADIDNDGDVTIRDLLRVLHYVSGTSSEL